MLLVSLFKRLRMARVKWIIGTAKDISVIHKIKNSPSVRYRSLGATSIGCLKSKCLHWARRKVKKVNSPSVRYRSLGATSPRSLWIVLFVKQSNFLAQSACTERAKRVEVEMAGVEGAEAPHHQGIRKVQIKSKYQINILKHRRSIIIAGSHAISTIQKNNSFRSHFFV